jgi:hypothetical protein
MGSSTHGCAYGPFPRESPTEERGRSHLVYGFFDESVVHYGGVLSFP